MSQQPIHILYIDDNHFDRDLVRDALERENVGFVLTDIANQAQLARALNENTFDLILSDFNVVGLTGLDVLDLVHAHDPNLPVIIVTGTGTEEIAVEAMKRGAADYVIKTLHHLRRLPSTIHTALERKVLAEKRRQAEKALHASEARYRSLLETASAAIIILNRNGLIDMVNARTETLFGYDKSELLGWSAARLIPWPFEPADSPPPADYLFQLAEKVQCASLDLRGRRQDGSEFPLEISLSRTQTDDEDLIMCFISDISVRKEAEQKIIDSLNEKEILLREIHHRVKNNLQIISSLLDLQSTHIRDEQTLLSLQESQNRVRSMALIHEMLYQAEGFSQIDFTTYIKNLSNHLYRTYAIGNQDVRLVIEADQVTFNLDTAITCGLILNELISNCLKHAFPDKQRGQIYITLQAEPSGQVGLVIRDDGIGLPPPDRLETIATIGLKLVRTLIKKLKGELTIERDAGTTFIFRFPQTGISD